MDPSRDTHNTPQTTTRQNTNFLNYWKELIKIVFISLAIVIPFRFYIAQPFIVDGASMDPTFETGNYLIVDEITYHFKTPERGSILIFKYPENPSKSFIKRVIGLPNETVLISSGKVTIINSQYPNGILLDEPYIKLKKDEDFNYTLGTDEYFVLGDNRSSSADSRIWGSVPKENIIGRPIIRFFPPSIFPGDYSDYDGETSNEY